MTEFFNRMKFLLGDEFENFEKSFDKKHFKGLRVNTLKCKSEKFLNLFPYKLKKTPFCENGFYILDDISGLGNHPLHHAGAFYIQEPSATCAVTMLNVQKGDKVLDLCAAPGGKTTQIAAALQGTGIIWSNELVKSRANVLLSNMERMGVKNFVVSSCHPQMLCENLQGFFDKILVDAPCSGEGMFRKDKTAREQWSVEHVKSCAQRQLMILNSAKTALKTDGIMVYSTCTFSYEENEGVITEFLRENPDFEIEDSGYDFGRNTLNYAKRIFPMDGGEGHFACRMRKKSESPHTLSNNVKGEKVPESVLEFYNDVFINEPFGKNLTLVGEKIIAMPENLPNLKGLGVLRAGVLLGEIKKNRIEPAHSAFMACNINDCKNTVDFDYNSDEIKKFLHGEEIKVDGNVKGYTAVCVNSITTGFGKASNGRLKNKYPKGLRIL